MAPIHSVLHRLGIDGGNARTRGRVEVRAAKEGGIVNGDEARGERHGDEGVAAFESAPANGGDALGDGDGGKGAAVIRKITPNLGDAGREGEGDERREADESTTADLGDAVGDDEGSQVPVGAEGRDVAINRVLEPPLRTRTFVIFKIWFAS